MANRQRFVMSLVAASCVGLMAVGCSDSDTPQGDQSRPKLSKIEIPDAGLSATVEGQPLPDVDLTKFQCYNESDLISLHGQDPHRRSARARRESATRKSAESRERVVRHRWGSTTPRNSAKARPR